MRITSDGQVTIPEEIRERAGLLPNTEVEFIFDGQTVTLVKASSVASLSQRAQMLEQLRGKGDIKLTTDEIMAMTRGE